MLLLIALLAAVIFVGEKFGETAGVIGMALLIAFLLMVFISAASEEEKAYRNRRKYWASGGPDRKKQGKQR